MIYFVEFQLTVRVEELKRVDNRGREWKRVDKSRKKENAGKIEEGREGKIQAE